MAGVPSYQRKQGAKLRDLTVKELIGVLEDSENKKYGKDFRQQILLRLAGSVLPRIQELSGEDGEPIQIQVLRANGTE